MSISIGAEADPVLLAHDERGQRRDEVVGRRHVVCNRLGAARAEDDLVDVEHKHDRDGRADHEVGRLRREGEQDAREQNGPPRQKLRQHLYK